MGRTLTDTLTDTLADTLTERNGGRDMNTLNRVGDHVSGKRCRAPIGGQIFSVRAFVFFVCPAEAPPGAPVRGLRRGAPAASLGRVFTWQHCQSLSCGCLASAAVPTSGSPPARAPYSRRRGLFRRDPRQCVLVPFTRRSPRRRSLWLAPPAHGFG